MLMGTMHRMPRRNTSIVRRLVSFAALGSIGLGAAGCQTRKNTINQIEPYAGKRPEPIVQLPPKDEAPAPEPGRRHPTGGGSGWVPPGGISGRWECVVIHHSDSDKS